MIEMLDVFDDAYMPAAPFQATYDDVHAHGYWHQTFAGWLVNPARKTVILQLRGPQNRVGPNTFDASAGGHLISGEGPADGFREMQEELGISVLPEDRFYLGVYRNVALLGEYINREFCHVYLGLTALSPQEMTPQAGEVNGIFEVSIADALALFGGAASTAKVSGVLWNGTRYDNAVREMTRADMCNSRERCDVTRYYLKVFQAARDYLAGERALAI